MTRHPRRGFTLFELLSVLALLALLFALLLPALAKMRQSSDRVRSQNNLKQIGLACHNYHDSFAVLPPGNDSNNFSVASRLLPFIEQQNVFQSINFKLPITDKANADARKTSIAVYLSPLDPQPAAAEDYGATNYLFNAGSKDALEDNDGVCYQNSRVKFTDITDGTANTLMAGETLRGDGGKKAVDVRRQYVLLKDRDALKGLKPAAGVADFKDNKNIAGDRCARWIDGRFLQGTFTGTRMANDPRPDVNCDGAGGLSGLRSLDNFVNVLMVDGSVRTVNAKLDLKVWQLLSSRNDGQPVPDF